MKITLLFHADLVLFLWLRTLSQKIFEPDTRKPESQELFPGLMSYPVGLGTSSRILRASLALFVLSRNLAATDFEHFLSAFICRFLVNGSDAQ